MSPGSNRKIAERGRACYFTIRNVYKSEVKLERAFPRPKKGVNMLKRTTLMLLTVAIFAAVPAFAAKTGCQKHNFLGAYTRVDPAVDVFNDGSAVHQYIYQLHVSADGSFRQYWTGLPDYTMNIGTGTEQTGSWTCRADGKLVAQYIFATYVPSAITNNTPNPDIELLRHTRVTVLFDVPDNNTLVRIQARARSYAAGADPTDPNGGTLGPLSTTQLTYNRFVASDADLLLP